MTRPSATARGCVANQRDQPQSAVESGMSRTEESAHAAASISTADNASTTATVSGDGLFPGRDRKAMTVNSMPVSETCARRSWNNFIPEEEGSVERV